MTLACAFCVWIASSGGWCALRAVVECVADMDEDDALDELLLDDKGELIISF